MATYEEMMARAKALHAEGRTDDAKRLAQIALKTRETAPETPQKSFGQVLKENLLGDNDPTTQNTGEKIGSFLNKAGESLTFGLVGDEASAAVESLVPGVDYADRRDHYRQQEEILERDNPGAALTADVGGSLAGAALPFGAIGTLSRGARLAPRIAASSGVGAAGAGTYGFAEGEGLQDRLQQGKLGASLGGIFGAAIPVAGAGIQRIADALAQSRVVKAAAKNAPSTDALRKIGQSLYRQVDDAGVSVRPDALRSKTSEIVDAMRSQGLDEGGGALSLNPKAERLTQLLSDASEGANTVPFQKLDQLRRKAGGVASEVANKQDARFGAEAVSQLDDFVQKLTPDQVDGGDIELLKSTITKARDTWAKMSRSQLIDDAIDASQDYLSGGASGIRNQFKRIVNNPKLNRGFSEAELKMMRRVINGTIPEQLLNLAGSGLGQLLTIGGGGGLGSIAGPAGAGIGALAGAGVGALARKGSEAVSRKNAELVRALIANGGLKQIPQASDQARRIAESLMRRTVAAAPQ